MIRIAGRAIGTDCPPFIIAEMSGNHNQSLERAMKIVDAAAEAGAHAVKLQTFTADTMTIDRDDGEFFISDKKSLWKGKSLYALYQEAATPWSWQKDIFEHARARGMICLSTPFDASAVEFLEKLNSPCYKIASFENTDLPLIRVVASTKKPLIISTGMATLREIGEMVETVQAAGCNDIVLLKCTSTYPATPENTNLATIPHMRTMFGTEVGLSDHTMGIGVSIASVALGASVIEKHFTLRRADGGVDSTFSMEPDEMAALVTESGRAWQALGTIQRGPLPDEIASMQFRRSLYVVEDVPAGTALTARNVRAIRPGHGLSPKYYDTVVGQVVARDVKRGTPVGWDLFKPS